MMGSRSRKRAKPNPTDAAAGTAATASTASLPTAIPSEPSSNVSHPSQDSSSGVAASMPSLVTGNIPGQDTPSTSQQDSLGENNGTLIPRKTSRQAHKTRSWYGSWPRAPKSSPSTQVARETIQGGTLKTKGTVDFSRFDTKKSADAMSLDGVPESESASVSTLPPAHDPTPVVQNTEAPKPVENEPITATTETTPKDDNSGREPTSDSQKNDAPGSIDPKAPVEPGQRPTTASSWLGWFARPANTTTDPNAPPQTIPEATPQPPNTTEPVAPKDSEEIRPSEPAKAAPQEEPVQEAPQTTTQLTIQESAAPAPAPGSSWFGFWHSTTAAPAAESSPLPASATPEVPQEERQQPQEPEDTVMEDAPPLDTLPTPPPKAGSTWAFWSRDTGKGSSKKPGQSTEQGQLAIIGEGSESHPERANAIDVKDTPSQEPPLKSGENEEQVKTTPPIPRDSPSKKSKRGRPQSMDLDEVPTSRPSTPKSEPPAKPESSAKSSAAKTPAAIKPSAPNLLLPAFTKTYQVKENPTLVQQIAQLLLRTQQPPAKHVHLSKEPVKFKKAIAIGVHGLFPATYLRTMIGQPTGTSIKFANHGADAIRRWADAHGCEDCEIEKVALEGEGRIGERVENLWKLLLNWIDHIRKADVIIFACHSQGVPVSIMLLAKLLELGIITTAKVGVCAMAGVSLGPFPDYRSGMGMLMGSAAQLWEFADPQSEVSKRLEVAMKTVLSYGVRLTFIGSIDDQLVPLESAIYAPAHHPHIYRAVFIDGRIHAPDFIAHLVGFALKLRNLGVTDHGLIRELSVPLAGSLYSGEGHSRLYDDEQVYDLAISHTLETTSVGNVPCEIHHTRQQGGAQPTPNNPYLLPWIMRGLLEEDFVKSELHSETAELLRQFDDWKPSTKALKDVKYRLEAVRSKL